MQIKTNEFFDDLKTFPSSAVINVSSAAAFQPVPYMAAYAATGHPIDRPQ